jgi:hypothetical protein
VKAPIPPDAALPQAQDMLDAEAMAPVLARLLGDASPVSHVDVTYVRYRPGMRLLVRYDVHAAGETHQAVALADVREDLAARVALPANAALTQSLAGRLPVRTPLAFVAELQALVQWSPLDVVLPVVAGGPPPGPGHPRGAGGRGPPRRAPATTSWPPG